MKIKDTVDKLHPRESRDNIPMGEHRYICFMLLRAERRACMRVVRAYKRKIGNERPEIGYGHILDACDDILKALARRGKK